MFISQTTAKNECQKDPIKTGQELLDSAPTLFNGIKSESFGDRLNVAHSRDEADHRSNGGNALRQHQRENALRQHQRRRRKRMRSFEVMMSDAIRRTSTPAAEFQPTRYGTKGCIVLFVITVCTVGAAIFIGLRLSGTDNNHTSIIAILAILIFAFLFEFVMLMWYCVMEHDDH
uniref:Uncharacterized protein n=1 Tax=Globodera rostochiensis TaxID=31243 RepID=A0A914HMG2_GLORO